MSYSAPQSVDEALTILKSGSPKIVAGCTDFFPAQPMGGRERNILDVNRIREIRGITEGEAGWRIGATTTWTDIVKAPLPAAFDALKQAAIEVGSVQIQNLGTVAGNICNASPAADGVPALIALQAEVEVASTRGTRRIPLEKFITGVRRIDLAADEMVVAIHVPALPEAEASAFLKLGSRRYLVISIVMVAANVTVRDGVIEAARIAVGACSPVAARLPALEDHVKGQRAATLAAPDFRFTDKAFFAPLSPIADVRGSAEYRMDAVAELCRRALVKAAGMEN